MDAIIKAMSDAQLEALKEEHSKNQTIVTLVEGILEARVKEAEQSKLKAQFEASVTKLFSKLAHPEAILNIYARWSEVEEEDTTKEPEEVEVIDTEGNKVKEMRLPKVKTFKWIVEACGSVHFFLF